MSLATVLHAAREEATIHDVEGARLGQQLVEDVDLVHLTITNVNESGNIAAQIFPTGASLPDADRLFNAGLGGNADLFEGDKINERALRNLVRAAVDYNPMKLFSTGGHGCCMKRLLSNSNFACFDSTTAKKGLPDVKSPTVLLRSDMWE